MVQAFNGWAFTVEAQVNTQVTPYGICGGQSGTGTGFSLSSSVFLCQYRSPVAVHSHISAGGINKSSLFMFILMG
jgi:hypothetical protein